jgi:hypothetical protein
MARQAESVVDNSQALSGRAQPRTVESLMCDAAFATHAMRLPAKEAAPRNFRAKTIHHGPVDNEFNLRVKSNVSPALGRNATED